MHLYLIADISEYLSYKEVCVIEQLCPSYGYDINYSNGVIWTYFMGTVKTVKKTNRCVRKRVALYGLNHVPNKGCIKRIWWEGKLNLIPLTGLTSLKRLGIYCKLVVDVTPLAGLTSLTELSLIGTLIKDVTPLAGLISLITLLLSYTRIKDVTPLAGLISLKQLNLCYTQVVDITPLKGLITLTKLNLLGTQVVDITPLSGLISLTYLDLSGTQVVDVSMIPSTCYVDNKQII